MKILIIAEKFPPLNTIGSVRWGKMAKYFVNLGHDIRVITNMHRETDDLTLPLEISESSILRVISRRFTDFVGENYSVLPKGRKIIVRLGVFIRHQFPWALARDDSLGWMTPAIKEGRELTKNWEPDVIVSSALPITSHFIARALLMHCGKKTRWIADYRDLWSGGHGARVDGMRRLIYPQVERWLLTPCDLLVTVSDPLAETLRLTYQKKVLTIYNGFDVDERKLGRNNGEDSQKSDSYLTVMPEIERPCSPEVLWICYLGSIYEGRSPRLLFEAMASSSALAGTIYVTFYTDSDAKSIESLAADFRLSAYVKIMGKVPYVQSLEIQRAADVLLYIGYQSQTHPGQGILSGKAFEYLQASKPILALHTDASHPLVADGLMTPANTEDELRTAINDLIKKKKHCAHETGIDLNLKREKWTRKAQAEKFLKGVVKK